jgi:dephospho-CoA kinase
MQPGEPVYVAIIERFGQAVVRGDGSLDRKALAELAFQHNQAAALNHIVHPAVIAAEEEWMRGVFAADGRRVAIVESALIFEVEKWGTAPGWVQRFDKVILVVVPDEVKIARFVSRMMAGDGADSRRETLTRDARARMAAQIPDQEKAGRCEYVIDNSGSLIETRRVVERIYRELVQAAISGK